MISAVDVKVAGSKSALDWLVGPHAALKDETRRWQARFLAALSLPLAAFFVVGAYTVPVYLRSVMLAGALLMALAYGLKPHALVCNRGGADGCGAGCSICGGDAGG